MTRQAIRFWEVPKGSYFWHKNREWVKLTDTLSEKGTARRYNLSGQPVLIQVDADALVELEQSESVDSIVG